MCVCVCVCEYLCMCVQEHKCVLDSCRALESEGLEVTYLPVGKNGIISLKVNPLITHLITPLPLCLCVSGAGGCDEARHITGLSNDCQQ